MQILYHPRAFKFLRKLPQKEVHRVLIAIQKLQNPVISSSLNIKKLVTTKRSLRLRIGDIRVIYEMDKEKKIIYIHEIDFRGNVY